MAFSSLVIWIQQLDVTEGNASLLSTPVCGAAAL
jgi:hypothetical protein